MYNVYMTYSLNKDIGLSLGCVLMLYWCVLIVAERKISEDSHLDVNYIRMAVLRRVNKSYTFMGFFFFFSFF